MTVVAEDTGEKTSCTSSDGPVRSIEGRVFFCQESLHDTNVIYVLRFTGTLDSILNVFKRICSMDMDSSVMGSGAIDNLSDLVSFVVSDFDCEILEDESGSDSAFDYLCESYTRHRYPFLVVTHKTPATAYKNYTSKFTYTLGTPVTDNKAEFTRSKVRNILDKMPADNLAPLPIRIYLLTRPKKQ